MPIGLMSLSFFVISVVAILVAVGRCHAELAFYEISGSSIQKINSIFLCVSDSFCFTPDKSFVMTSKFRMRGKLQKLWYVAASHDPHNPLFGVIVSDNVVANTTTGWRNLANNKTLEDDMKLVRLSSRCAGISDVDMVGFGNCVRAVSATLFLIGEDDVAYESREGSVSSLHLAIRQLLPDLLQYCALHSKEELESRCQYIRNMECLYQMHVLNNWRRSSACFEMALAVSTNSIDPGKPHSSEWEEVEVVNCYLLFDYATAVFRSNVDVWKAEQLLVEVIERCYVNDEKLWKFRKFSNKLGIIHQLNQLTRGTCVGMIHVLHAALTGGGVTAVDCPACMKVTGGVALLDTGAIDIRISCDILKYNEVSFVDTTLQKQFVEHKSTRGLHRSEPIGPGYIAINLICHQLDSSVVASSNVAWGDFTLGLMDSVVVINAFLNGGAHIQAAIHIKLSLLNECNRYDSSTDDSSASFKKLVNEFNVSTVNKSAAMAILLTIKADQECVVTNGQAFSLYINALLQIASPTVNTDNKAGAMEELLHIVSKQKQCYEVLRDLGDICSGRMNYCQMANPVDYVGARGLFLMAYQKRRCAYDVWMCGDEEGIRDQDVPSQYYRLVSIVQYSLIAETPLTVIDEGVAMKGLQKAQRICRIGFISSYWFRHSVGKLIARVIIDLKAKWPLFDCAVEVHVVQVTDSTGDESSSYGRFNDDLTEALRAASDHWTIIPTSNGIVSAWRTLVELSLDILVFGDIFMDSFTAHLARKRVAPKQVAFWGHPFTSGMHSIDYFVSSALFEYEDQLSSNYRISQYSEQLVLFDSLTFSFYDAEMDISRNKEKDDTSVLLTWLYNKGRDIDGQRFFDKSPSASGAAGLSEGTEWFELISSMHLGADPISLHMQHHSKYIIYNCFQTIMKMHPHFDSVIANILLSENTSLIVLQRNGKQVLWQRMFEMRLFEAVQAAASDTVGRVYASQVLNRIVFLSQMPSKDYLKLVGLADVTLDPFPFGGGVTIMDSLLRNVPVVSAGSLQTVHQLGKGIVEHLASSDYIASLMIANNAEEYVSKAVQLGQMRRNDRFSSIESCAIPVAPFPLHPNPTTCVDFQWFRCSNSSFMESIHETTVSEWIVFLQQLM